MNPTSHPAFDHSAFEADFKAFLDGELPFWRRVQVRRHLQTCPHCREELRIMQLIETELKTEEAAPIGADLRAKILDSAPVETPKVTSQARVHLAPRLIAGVGGLAVLAALMIMPNFMGGGGGGGFGSMQSDKAMAPQSQMPAQMASKRQAGESLAAPPSVAAGAGAADNFLNGARTGASFRRDVRSRALNGVGSSIYLDDVVPAQRQVHKQGSLSVTVDDAEAKGSSVEILVKNVGGFIAQNALSTAGDGRKTATLDVRVPVAQFEAVVGKIGKLGAVREKSVNGEDITLRVTQAGAQKASLARELSIREAQLREADPKKIAARRNIVSDVRQLRFQANQARAQLEYLQKYAALATLFVTLQDKAKVAPIASSTTELKGTARAAWSSFLTTAQWPIQLVIWILAYSPLWIPALIIWKKWGHKMLSAG